MEKFLVMTIGTNQLFSNGTFIYSRHIGHALYNNPFDISKWHAKHNVVDTPENRARWVEMQS